MSVPRFIVGATATAALFVALDLACVACIFLPRYRRALGDRMRQRPSVIAAVCFYALHGAALCVLVVFPVLARDDPWERAAVMAAAGGGVLACATYGTYALTNYAVLADWPLELVLWDVPYGACLGAGVAACAVSLAYCV